MRCRAWIAVRDGLPSTVPRSRIGSALSGSHYPRPFGGCTRVGCILREEFQLAGLDKKVWQYFTVVPDFKSVGVRDNARSFDWPVIIRAVNTVDAMTATIEPVDWPILMKITDRILKEVKNVNRVCYDMSPKPNATIEWE